MRRIPSFESSAASFSTHHSTSYCSHFVPGWKHLKLCVVVTDNSGALCGVLVHTLQTIQNRFFCPVSYRDGVQSKYQYNHISDVILLAEIALIDVLHRLMTWMVMVMGVVRMFIHMHYFKLLIIKFFGTTMVLWAMSL